MIINNTKRGMMTFTDQELIDRLRLRAEQFPVAAVSFYTFTDLEDNDRERIRRVRSYPWIPPELSDRGFIYDVDTGRLNEVSSEREAPDAAWQIAGALRSFGGLRTIAAQNELIWDPVNGTGQRAGDVNDEGAIWLRG